MEEIKKEIIEKVILVAVADQDTTEAEESLDELEELVKTAGAEVAARVIQVIVLTFLHWYIQRYKPLAGRIITSTDQQFRRSIRYQSDGSNTDHS